VPGWACLRAVGTDQVRAGQPRARDEPVLPSRALLRGPAARKAAVAAGAVVDGRCAAHALHVLVVRTTPAGCIGAWHAPASVNCSAPSALSDKHVERLAGGEVARRASRRVAQRSTVAESCLVLPRKAERARNAAGGVVGGVVSAASLGVISWRAAKLRLGRAAGDAHPVSNLAPQDARAGDVVSRGAGGAAGAVLKVFLCIYATCERMLLGLQVIIMSTKSAPNKREGRHVQKPTDVQSQYVNWLKCFQLLIAGENLGNGSQRRGDTLLSCSKDMVESELGPTCMQEIPFMKEMLIQRIEKDFQQTKIAENIRSRDGEWTASIWVAVYRKACIFVVWESNPKNVYRFSARRFVYDKPLEFYQQVYNFWNTYQSFEKSIVQSMRLIDRTKGIAAFFNKGRALSLSQSACICASCGKHILSSLSGT